MSCFCFPYKIENNFKYLDIDFEAQKNISVDGFFENLYIIIDTPDRRKSNKRIPRGKSRRIWGRVSNERRANGVHRRD